MKQTSLPLDDEQSAPPVVPLEAEQEQALIELMAQAIVAIVGAEDAPASGGTREGQAR